MSNSFRLSSAQYDEQYQVTFQITKLNCDDMNDISFTDIEMANIRRWLMQKKYKKFIIFS